MCNHNDKLKSILFELLTGARKLSDQTKKIEELFNTDVIETFNETHDHISNAIRELIGTERYTVESDNLFMLVFDYVFSIRDDIDVVIDELLEMKQQYGCNCNCCK